jgi:hypothetical protein
MDAATRSMSTPVGQVENPILNAFDSEYFLGPGKKYFFYLCSMDLLKSGDAVQSKEKA